MTRTIDFKDLNAEARSKKHAKRLIVLHGDDRFACPKIGAHAMRRVTCALRFVEFTRSHHALKRQRRNTAQMSRIGNACSGCATGAAHYQGKRPKDAPSVPMPARVVQESIGRTVQLGAGGCSAERYPNPKSKHGPMAPSRPVLIHAPTFALPTLEEW